METDAPEDYKMDLLGPQLLEAASLDYWMLEVCRRIGVDPIEWRQVHPLKYQGMVIAQYQLSNKLDLIERHVAMQYNMKRRKYGDTAKSPFGNTSELNRQRRMAEIAKAQSGGVDN
jgi:hypothetical protein